MNERILRVGLDHAAPIPLHTDIRSGNFEGFEVDLMNEIAKALDLEKQHSVALWKVIIEDLLNGKIDVICSAATITKEREKTVAISKPYLQFHLCVVSHKYQPLTASDLAEKRIRVRASTEAEEYLKRHYPGKDVQLFDSNEKQYECVVNKQVNALIDDAPIAYGFTSKQPLLTLSEIIADTPSQYAIIINKKKLNLKTKLIQ